MIRPQKGRLACSSRRGFAKILGLAVAGSVAVPGPMTGAQPDNGELEAQARLATEGSPVRLNQAELADLKKDIQEGRKGLAKIREFKVEAGVEPAFVFRAK